MSTVGWTIRDGVRSDQPALRELCLLSFLAEDTADEAGLERVIWSPPHLDGVILVAERAGEPIGFLAGATSRAGATTGFVTAVAVHPDLRRHGIGRALVDRFEDRLRSAGARHVWTGGSQPTYWWPGVDPRYAAARQLFTRAGFTVADEAFNMVVDLSAEVIADTPVTGVTMRRLTRDEFDRFQAWVGASWADGWQHELELTLLRDPVSCFVAIENGEYIGFAAYDTNQRGVFGPMGSATAARGRGVGRALLRRCLRDLFLRGERVCQISWVGPETFYQSAVAARRDRHFDRLRKELTP